MHKESIYMRKESLNNKGFGLIAVLAVIVVLALASGAGAYVYHRDHKANNSNTTAHATTTGGRSHTTPSSKTQAQQQYLDIKEWGVKLPLSSAIADAYYVASTSSKDANEEPNTVWLGLTSLDANGCSASNGNDGKSPILAALVRVSPTATNPVTGESYKQQDPNGVTVGEYYYGYTAYAGLQSGSKCGSATNLAAVNSAFKNAAAGITSE
jgi:hypothetical protein